MVKKVYKAQGVELPFIDIPHLATDKSAAPGASDKDYAIGDLWMRRIDADTRTFYAFGGLDSSGDAIWSILSPGSSDVDTLTGDSGGALSPSGGNITLAGGTNITTSGSSSTITFNLDAAIVLATSVSAPLYTAAAGIDLDITAPSGQDIVMKLGDAAGANKFSITDSADSEVFAVDSNGDITFTNFSNTGTFTTSGGTASINASSNFNTVINSGTSTGTVTIGNSAAGAISVDTTAGITLNADTASSFTVTDAANDLTLASTLGTVIVNAGEDVADAIYLHADAGTSETIRVHSDQGTGAASVELVSDVGGVTLTSGLASSDAINLNASAGGVDIDGALDIVLTSTEDAADSILLHANGGTSESIRLHSDQGTAVGSVQLESDVGGITLLSGLASADAINLNASAGGLDLDGALQVNIASSQAAVADSVRIVASAADGGVDIDAGTGGMALDSTGAMSLNGAAASDFTVTGAFDLTVSSSAGSVIIDGGEAVEDAVVIDASNAAGGITLQTGGGDITVSATVKEISAEFLEASGDEITAFSQSPLLTTAANTAGAATGAGGDVNLMYCQQGVLLEQFIIGTQTIIGPRMDGTGLDISLDQTAADGVEYNWGAARTNSRHAFTIGTSAAFFFEVTLNVEDLSGCDPLLIGFRKAEANNATLANYTDYATIGINQVTSATNIVLMTEVNAGGQTITDTTDAWGGDGTARTLRVLVDGSGNVTYTIDGSAPSATAAFQFDNTDVVCPFIHFVQGADVTKVWATSLKVGFQA